MDRPDETPPEIPQDRFRTHLDACPECREGPFSALALCPTGAKLLVWAARDSASKKIIPDVLV